VVKDICKVYREIKIILLKVSWKEFFLNERRRMNLENSTEKKETELVTGVRVPLFWIVLIL